LLPQIIFNITNISLWPNLIYRFNPIMIAIFDPTVKSRCCILNIHEDGYSTLFPYLKGLLLGPSSPLKNNSLVSMENKNSHKAKAGLVAVLMSCNPHLLGKGTFIPHEIVFTQGIVWNSIEKVSTPVYHKWTMSHQCTNLYAIITSKDPNPWVIDQLFEKPPSTIDISLVYVLYFNQVAGPLHHSFTRFTKTF